MNPKGSDVLPLCTTPVNLGKLMAGFSEHKNTFPLEIFPEI